MPIEVAIAAPSLAAIERLVPQAAPGGLWVDASALGLATDEEREVFSRLAALARAAGFPDPARVYFGHETCEHLVPTPREWRRAIECASQHGFSLTAVLPPTRASREEAVAATLELLARAGVEEVVCAEWGTAAMVRAAGLKPVLGRLMNRMKRLERWAVDAPEPAQVEPDRARLGRQLRVARRVPLLEQSALALAAEVGAVRVEIDPVPQGVRFPSGDLQVGISLHVPWTIVTTGRRCLVRAEATGTRPLAGGDCPAPCSTISMRPVFDARMPPVVQRGNAVYLANTAFLSDLPRWLPPDARLVVHPMLP